MGEKKKNEVCVFLLWLAVAILLSAFIVNFIMTPVTVIGESMEPTITDHSYAFSSRLALRDVERFDIVTVSVNDKLLIKRVIGLPGEEIEYVDSRLYVNGKYVPEDFLDSNVATEDFSCVVPLGSYFLMGDNREVSIDSRYYGAFGKKDLIAGDIFVLYPFSNFGKV